jgi:hypothetical protein
MTMTRWAIGLALLSICTASCATAPEYVVAPPPPNPMGAFVFDTAVREFAGPATYLGPTPTVVVLLNKDQPDRNRAFCSGFAQLDTGLEAAQNSVVAGNVVRTRWLVQNDDLNPAPADCAAMIAAYDFARAEAVMAQARDQAELAPALTGAGPFLLEVLPDSSMIVVSGSSLPQSQLRGFGRNWVIKASAQFDDWSQDTAVRDCLGEVQLSLNDFAGQTSKYLQCQFPEGVTIAHAKVAVCVIASLAGWNIPFVCNQT